MFAIQYAEIITCKKQGDTKQQTVNFYHTGRTERHDDRPWYLASDIQEIKASVKSDGFTLADGRSNYGDTFAEKWEDFKNRDASELYIYVTADFIGYYMTITEFEEFVKMWCYFSSESSKNGGFTKIRCKHESQKMRRWLANRAA